MKNSFKKLKEYRYKKRLKKWFGVNIKLMLRRLRRFFKSGKLGHALSSVPAVMTYLSVFVIAAVAVGSVFFTKYTVQYFDSDQKIIRRLKMPAESVGDAPYLTALNAFGSSNRIQITLKTDTEDYLKPRGVSLEKGGVNIILTFADGTETEFSLSNSNYDTFESGMTDTFTLILPFGYTPFDITDYTITVVPNVKSDYGTWHCKWARAYFLMNNEPVMLAKESWEDCAVFGEGDGSILKSSLSVVHNANDEYVRTRKLYSYYLQLAQAGMTDFADKSVKADALDALAINSAKTLCLDIETANIDMQNTIFTYYTKGVELSETDSLDYDGLIYLDVKFYTPLSDGSFTKSFVLDILGTDDFELGTTAQFSIELPEGMTVFDISKMSIRTDNPYDSWAPRYVRAYINTDYKNPLEIARLSDTMLINDYSTPVFFKNLIDSGVELNLVSRFSLSKVVRAQLESKNGISFGGDIEKMYFELISFYDRQEMFFKKLTELYSKNAYDPETSIPTLPTPDIDANKTPTETPDDDFTEEPKVDTEENTDATVDTPVDETTDATVDTPVDETTDATVDTPEDETTDATVDTPEDETTDTTVDTPEDETTDTTVDTPEDESNTEQTPEDSTETPEEPLL